MNLCFDQSEEYVDWVCEKLKVNRVYFGNCSTITIEGEHRVVAVYSSFNGVNCEVTIAAETTQWLNKKYLRILLAYPFRQLGCRRITVLIKDSNCKVIRAAEKVGFKNEGTLRKFMESGENVIILGYLKEEYEMGKYNVTK